MCLAVPGKVIQTRGEEAIVDMQGNRLRVDVTLTPGVTAGQWVLVHAGFAIAAIAEADALETWEYLRATAAQAPEQDDEVAAAEFEVDPHPGKRQ